MQKAMLEEFGLAAFGASSGLRVYGKSMQSIKHHLPQCRSDRLHKLRYGERFVCAVRRGNCVATQFHPELHALFGTEVGRADRKRTLVGLDIASLRVL